MQSALNQTSKSTLQKPRIKKEKAWNELASWFCETFFIINK